MCGEMSRYFDKRIAVEELGQLKVIGRPDDCAEEISEYEAQCVFVERSHMPCLINDVVMVIGIMRCFIVMVLSPSTPSP
jgi:hypothetical protein